MGGDVHANVIQADGTVEVEAEARGVRELLEIGWTLALVFPFPRQSSLSDRTDGRSTHQKYGILTVTVKLACAPDREDLLALILLVRAEGALLAFRGEGHIGRVAERELVIAAAAAGAGRVGGTVCHAIAVGLELEGALLELLVGGVAWLEPVYVAGADLDSGEREKERGGEEK